MKQFCNYNFILPIFILCVSAGCNSSPKYEDQPSQQEFIMLTKKIPILKNKYHLKEIHFLTDNIYKASDFKNLLQQITDTILSEKKITVSVSMSADSLYYLATLSNNDTTVVFSANAKSPVLPDNFFPALEKLPQAFSATTRLYNVNPVIGITGQDAWYFCGEESVLLQAKKEGMPLVGPNENPFESSDFKKLKSHFISNSVVR